MAESGDGLRRGLLFRASMNFPLDHLGVDDGNVLRRPKRKNRIPLNDVREGLDQGPHYWNLRSTGGK